MAEYMNFCGPFATMDDALKFCDMVAYTDFCPVSYRPVTFLNKICGQDQEARKNPENIKKAREISKYNILNAIMYGAELGLSPHQSLNGVAVVNGKPTLYGDALKGYVLPHCEYFYEYFNDSDPNNLTAVCQILRKGWKHPVICTFSVNDARQAGLLGKSGPWSQYRNQMLKMRARGFAIRDVFPDLLHGFITPEEAADYPAVENQEIPQIPQEQTAYPQPAAISQQNVSIPQQNVAVQQVQMQQPASVQPVYQNVSMPQQSGYQLQNQE